MAKEFPGGAWPTMVTPFTTDGDVDYPALERMVDWYIAGGVSGLFAVCQSSEMFLMSLADRLAVARFVKDKAAGRVPVITSGHIADGLDNQAAELCAMAETGVDALILITNRLAKAWESDDIWLDRLERLLERLPADIPLGFYECPYPYKRLLSPAITAWCARNGRFHFLKDTCCEIGQIREKLAAIRNSPFKLYNANTSTLLQSLRDGAAGYSGVMANFQPALYAWLCDHADDPRAEELSDELTICSFIERQSYPLNAKFSLSLDGLPVGTVCRAACDKPNSTFFEEVRMLHRVTQRLHQSFSIPDTYKS